MVPISDSTTRRHPRWRGERKAVLVRIPVGVAEVLRVQAMEAGTSVSDLVAMLIGTGMAVPTKPVKR